VHATFVDPTGNADPDAGVQVVVKGAAPSTIVGRRDGRRSTAHSTEPGK
jgi:hypothetical protein